VEGKGDEGEGKGDEGEGEGDEGEGEVDEGEEERSRKEATVCLSLSLALVLRFWNQSWTAFGSMFTSSASSFLCLRLGKGFWS